MAVEIRHSTVDDIGAVATSLARAVHDDPVKLFLAGGTTLSEERVALFFRAFQQMQLPHGHVYTTADRGAAALWAPPGEWKLPLRSLLRHSATFLKLYGTRFIPNLRVLRDMEKAPSTEPHHHLEIIGTDPHRCG